MNSPHTAAGTGSKRPQSPGSSSAETVSLVALIEKMERLEERLGTLVQGQSELLRLLSDSRTTKEWYSTTELASEMKVSQFTVQERWCRQGRIQCEKDPQSGKWRIPGGEYRRLVNGGGLLPRK